MKYLNNTSGTKPDILSKPILSNSAIMAFLDQSNPFFASLILFSNLAIICKKKQIMIYLDVPCTRILNAHLHVGGRGRWSALNWRLINDYFLVFFFFSTRLLYSAREMWHKKIPLEFGITCTNYTCSFRSNFNTTRSIAVVRYTWSIFFILVHPTN